MNPLLTATFSAPDIACLQTTGSITINASGGTLPYSYSVDAGNTYQSSNIFNTLGPGTYSCNIKDSLGCIAEIMVTLKNAATPNLAVTNPSTVCKPATIDLTAPAVTTGSDPGLSFSFWRDSAATIPLANPSIVSDSGTYFIKGTTTDGCFTIKAVDVNIENSLPGMRYPPVLTTPNVSTILQARVIGTNPVYQWIPPDGLNNSSVKDPVFNYDKKTEYRITITSATGCVTVDTLLVDLVGIDPKVFIPKAWSPNGDGNNDYLIPLTVNISQLNYFVIFNRWGKKVFETNVTGHGWDGKLNGIAQPMDVYIWIVVATGVNGEKLRISGQSILLR